MKRADIDGGRAFDWGQVSQDYAKYRDIYPEAFYQAILDLGLCRAGQQVLDLGTGTGVLPRHLKRYGAKFTGADIAENQISMARQLSEGMDIDYIVSPAEEVCFPDSTLDAVLACQCFIYFDRDVLLPRLHRMLRPEGKLLILSLIWLPFESSIAAHSEQLVLKYNPAWNGAHFTRPQMDTHRFDGTPFRVEKAFTLDMPVRFTRESWHGRMIACRGIDASSLPVDTIEAFAREHTRYLQTLPETFTIPHVAVFNLLQKR